MICPEAEYRESLSDEEFWAHVFQTDYPDWSDFDGPDLDEPYRLPDPCVVCGSTTACGYDNEGRPMIHTVEDNEDDYI